MKSATKTINRATEIYKYLSTKDSFTLSEIQEKLSIARTSLPQILAVIESRYPIRIKKSFGDLKRGGYCTYQIERLG